MTTIQIKELDVLLKDAVDISGDYYLHTINLTEPGENYGSLMVKLEIRYFDTKREQLHLVVKQIPASELLCSNFDVQVTFKNEVGLYDTIIPTLQSFQKNHGIKTLFDKVPQFYCARINLDGSELVTEDAALVLENLAVQGYKNIKRTVGFNLESAKLIVSDMAEFHATSLALKIKDLPTFDDKLKRYCKSFIFNDTHNIFWDATRAVIRENAHCAVLNDRIFCLGEVPKPEPLEPFACLVHGDLWSNNTMQIFDETETAIVNKFIDFQFLAYGSPASDFLFFVFTSVDLDVLRSDLDELIFKYHITFLNVLKMFQIDHSFFTYEKFINEIKTQTKYELGHILLYVLFVKHIRMDKTPLRLPQDADKLPSVITPRAKEYAWYIIQEWHRRGWC